MGIGPAELKTLTLIEISDAADAWNAAHGDGAQRLSGDEERDISEWLDTAPATMH